MSKKNSISLTLKDLKELGIIKKKNRKNWRKRKVVYIDGKTGKVLEGNKSLSNHMTGFGTQGSSSFMNSNNLAITFS